MRLDEFCFCGARFTAEDDNSALVVAELNAWRARHDCPRIDPWRREASSTTAGEFTFGFTRDYTFPSDERLQERP